MPQHRKLKTARPQSSWLRDTHNPVSAPSSAELGLLHRGLRPRRAIAPEEQIEASLSRVFLLLNSKFNFKCFLVLCIEVMQSETQ